MTKGLYLIVNRNHQCILYHDIANAELKLPQLNVQMITLVKFTFLTLRIYVLQIAIVQLTRI